MQLAEVRVLDRDHPTLIRPAGEHLRGVELDARWEVAPDLERFGRYGTALEGGNLTN